MRVSTAQFYFQNSQQLSNKQSDVNEQIGYLSSGKRIMTAKDDAIAFGTLAGYKNGLNNIEQYQRNITQAQSRNSLQETLFGNAEDLMQELRQLFIQANNGTLSNDDLMALGKQAENSQSQLLDIANSKDETGGYIFAGFQTETEPFVLKANNSVDYLGDSGIRQVQIAQNIMVETNQSGDEAFEKVSNPIGDFSPNYVVNNSGIQVKSAVIADPSQYDPVTNPPGYDFIFSGVAPSSDLTILDANGTTVYPTTTFTPGQTIAFPVASPGVEVQINGNPLPSDQFTLTPEKNISIFDAVKKAVDWINTPKTSANVTQRSVDYEETLNQLDKALDHMISRRTEAGVRLQLLETQESNHLDRELNLAKGQSNLEDIDFAKAVSTFEQSQVALQAAQQTFVQIKGLSLFNYI
jgi:flagellar hook-associated protein 3 FlgL